MIEAMPPLLWDDFAAAAPELAGIGLRRFDEAQLCMLGTIRRDGSPRISPCEMTFANPLIAGRRQASDRS